MNRLLLSGLLIALSIPAIAQNAFDGTWKFHLNDAQFPKKPDVFLLQDGMYQCKTCAPPIDVKADGQDQPVKGHPYFDSVSIRVVDDRTIEDVDKKNGEAEFKKAFELDPNDATAHHWYANDIARIGGREQEALAEAKRAHQLDPLSPIIGGVVGFIHIWARSYDEGIVACKELANENPTFAPAHDCLASAYWGKRMYPQVIEEFMAYDQLSSDRNESEFSSALEKGFRSGGWWGAETKAIETLQARRKTSYGSAFLIATLYADLGDKDQALRWLNIAYHEHEWRLIGLKTEFTFDSLRSDPRFAELMRKVGLPQ